MDQDSGKWLKNRFKPQSHQKMMRQINNSSNEPARINNEEFFDLHPKPWSIEKFTILEKITIFIDQDNPETFLIEVNFYMWDKARRMANLWSFILQNSDVDVYHSKGRLFFRRLLF